MDKNERIMAILGLLQKNQKVEVTDLAAKFQTSDMTIRRDLNELAKQYNIRRTHGGAVLEDQSVVRIVSFDENRIPHRAEKEKIAERAAGMIRNGQRIFIDAGSTTRIILDYLSQNIKAVVVTNHLEVAAHALQFQNLSVIMLGGEMLRITKCSSGPVAEEQLKKYRIDVAFIGAAAVGADGRLYDGYSPEARFKSSLFTVSKEVYVLADSSKINTYDLNEFGHLSNLAGLITDSQINEEGRILMKRHSVQLITV
ncbi:MAG: DeoR/GlpR family DNA-binding transcription regulator [Lachnospiraceae bacterium]|nr:DeoR/GlpR family DNA-binding transcription regulator [Lachnospiraceae bacterium]